MQIHILLTQMTAAHQVTLAPTLQQIERESTSLEFKKPSGFKFQKYEKILRCGSWRRYQLHQQSFATKFEKIIKTSFQGTGSFVVEKTRFAQRGRINHLKNYDSPPWRNIWFVNSFPKVLQEFYYHIIPSSIDTNRLPSAAKPRVGWINHLRAIPALILVYQHLA